jgi:hypothetical protein
MHGKVSRLLALIFLALPFLGNAGHKVDADDFNKMMTQGNYAAVFALGKFPDKPIGTEPNLIFKAQAQLGLGGFVITDLIQRVRAPQTFRPEHKILKEYFNGCPTAAIGKSYSGSPRCLVVRILNQAPSHHDQNLMGALETFKVMYKAKTIAVEQDRIIYSLLEMSMILSKIREALLLYASLNPDKVSYEEATPMIDVIRSAGEDLDTLSLHFKDVEGYLNEKFFGTKNGTIIRANLQGKAEFLRETGLPMFYKVTDMNREGSIEVAGRNILIHALDRADNFFRTAKN